MVILAIVSYLLVFFIRGWVQKRAILDFPNERSSHSSPTPRGGGLAIVIITIAAVIVYSLINGGWRESLVYLAGGSILAILGWRDDVKSLPARVRFLIQGLVAVGTIAGLGYFDALPFPFITQIPLGIFGILLTLVWIMGLTNAYNFMDGIDGIAGGVAVAGGLGWMILIYAGAGEITGLAFLIALVITASSAGFLGHNWHPARIFMGDVASIFLGYTFAVLPLLLRTPDSNSLMIGILVVWTFIIDAGITFIRRAVRHERLFSAHRSHLYQRMVIGGMSHPSVSLIFSLLTLVGAILAWGWMTGQWWSDWFILLGIPIFWGGFLFVAGNPRRLEKILGYLSLYREMGLGWMLFRISHIASKKLGSERRAFPVKGWEGFPLEVILKAGVPTDIKGFSAWKEDNLPAWVQPPEKGFPEYITRNFSRTVQDAERMLVGEWKYFSHEWINTGFPPDWHLDPLTGIVMEKDKPWYQIREYGDHEIKYAWEASRLSMVFTLVRAYAINKDERYPRAFWQLVENWMDQNPPGRGVNWQGSQEAALRLLALCFGYFAFRGSPLSTPERIADLTRLASAIGKRIHSNLAFSIHTGTNHAISEPFGLWLCGLAFPELKGSMEFRKIGRKRLEEQALKQLFNDGGYSMYSINYHRFVLQICCLAIRLGELNGEPFSGSLKERIGRSAEMIYQCMDMKTGEIPMFGSNDGALVLPLDQCDFTDFRPVLQLAYYTAHKKWILSEGPWDEDIYWLWGNDVMRPGSSEQPPSVDSAYPDAGLFILRSMNSHVVVRCVNYCSRPSHADQLHADLWWKGTQIAIDAGTYLYHGKGIWQNGLSRTGVHNTVSVDGNDQMVRLSRFTWGRRAQGRVMEFGKVSGIHGWQGMHDGYEQPGSPVKHLRSVYHPCGDTWLVIDHLTSPQQHDYYLQWLLADLPFRKLEDKQGVELEVNGDKLMVLFDVLDNTGDFSVVRASENSTRGWRSRYYGNKEPALSLALKTRSTNADFWTLFLPEGEDFSIDEVGSLVTKLIE